MLYQQLQDDLQKALVSRDNVRVEALRYLISQVKYLTGDFKNTPQDADVLTCIKKQVKQLTESAQLFTSNNRESLAKQYHDQIQIYQKYLPQELGDEELEHEIKLLITSLKETDSFDPKQCIGVIINRLGSKASPSRIVPIIQKLIQ